MRCSPFPDALRVAGRGDDDGGTSAPLVGVQPPRETVRWGCAACDIIPSLSSPRCFLEARPPHGAGLSLPVFAVVRRRAVDAANVIALIARLHHRRGIGLSKVTWADLAQIPAKAHLLIGELESSFFGGKVANDPFDSQRLREAVNLMGRVCARLKLDGSYTATTSRAESGSSMVLLPVRETRGSRQGRRSRPRASRRRRCKRMGEPAHFPLCPAVHECLVAVGGETDNRYAGRRRRERDHAAAARSLRWGDT